MKYLPQYQPPSLYGTYQPNACYQACIDPLACKMRVDGKGIVEVQPDMAVVVFGVSTENKQLQPAQKENAEIMTRIINTLKDMGISDEDIKTQTYSVEPQYDFAEGKQILRGYRVLHTIKITIENVGRVGKIIDSAVDNGANLVSNISFTLKDPSRYYRQALNASIEDAVDKALIIGKKLQINVQPVPIQLIEKSNEYATPIKPILMSVTQATTPIQTGQLEVTAEVEATFGYYH